VIGVVAVLAAACGPSTPSDRAQANMATLSAETTADKLLARGRAFAAVGDATRAEEYLTAALDQGADPHIALPLLMTVCVQTQRYRSAIQHAEDHLRRHPDDYRTRFVLGTLYAAVGDNKEAHESLEEGLRVHPDDATAHYALAVLARDAESDPVLADQHFREYLRLEPHGPHAEEARDGLLKRMP
jgi:uncharacterized protein HemY